MYAPVRLFFALCALLFHASFAWAASSPETPVASDTLPVLEVPHDILGRYTYTEPGCSGILELLPAARGYQAAVSTTCGEETDLCSETLFLDVMPGPEPGSLTLRNTFNELDIIVRNGELRMPESADNLCFYNGARMSGLYSKYTPPPQLLTEAARELEATLERMRNQLAEARVGFVRESAVGEAFPLGTQDTELSGRLMEAYLANPSTRVPEHATREQRIAALIAYHEKVLNSIGFSLEPTVISAFGVRNFEYWGFLKSSRRADVAAPYLAILDSPEVLPALLARGIVSRQVVQSLMDFAPWYRTAFP